MPTESKPLGMKPIPPEEWIVYPVVDSSVYLNRPPVRYEGDAERDHAAGSPPPKGKLPDE
jgi:hypothetical protein